MVTICTTDKSTSCLIFPLTCDGGGTGYYHDTREEPETRAEGLLLLGYLLVTHRAQRGPWAKDSETCSSHHLMLQCPGPAPKRKILLCWVKTQCNPLVSMISTYFCLHYWLPGHIFIIGGGSHVEAGSKSSRTDCDAPKISIKNEKSIL